MSLELGPCQVLFGTAGAEADLGKTEGGVIINFGTDVVDLTSDQYGTAPEEQVITGQKATIVIPLADITLDNLAIALNQTKLAKLNKYGIPGTNIVGTALKDTKAQSLLLKKYVSGAVSTDTEDWIRFAKAAPVSTFDYPFSKTDQRIIEVTFTAFPDDDDNLYYIGDETAASEGS